LAQVQITSRGLLGKQGGRGRSETEPVPSPEGALSGWVGFLEKIFLKNSRPT
jgi:hypothetical protein